MIKSSGFVPQNQNSISGSMNPDINIHATNPAKGSKSHCVLQAGKWHPAIDATETEDAKPGYFQPAGYNIAIGYLADGEIETRFSEVILFDPADLPEAPGTYSNAGAKLIAQLEVLCRSLLEASYPSVTFTIA